jgi:hypothetical protein
MAKANFDDIYTFGDPRKYFAVLGSLDYILPDVVEPVVRQLLEAKIRAGHPSPLVLDVGSSYGINAALHRFPVSLSVLRQRYANHGVAALSSDELARLDKAYYASWPELGLARFIGMDASAPAIKYALDVGLIESGVAADLESEPLTAPDAETVRPTDVILSTGCVGYVTPRTYESILREVDSPPWIISFVLRMFPYDEFVKLFAEFGLETEEFTGASFVQRRFRDVVEFEDSLRLLDQQGIQTEGFEAEGRLQADLYVSRPPEDIREVPLAEIVKVASGRGYPTGTRYVEVRSGNGLSIAMEP